MKAPKWISRSLGQQAARDEESREVALLHSLHLFLALLSKWYPTWLLKALGMKTLCLVSLPPFTHGTCH